MTFRLPLTRCLQPCQMQPELERQANTLLVGRLDYQPKRAKVIYALIKHVQPNRHRFDKDLPGRSIHNKQAAATLGASQITLGPSADAYAVAT